MEASAPERRLRGVALSPGVALGIPCILAPAAEGPHAESRGISLAEGQRLSESLAWAVNRLREIAQKAGRRLGPDAAEIFNAHRMILEDPMLQAQLYDTINNENIAAELAVTRHLKAYEVTLRDTDLPHIQERADDIADIRRTLIGRLRATNSSLSCRFADSCPLGTCSKGNDHVVIARELNPQLAMEVDAHTTALVVQHGGLTSHAAILLRALELPAVSGVEGLPGRIPEDALLLVDGTEGLVIINPSSETLSEYTRRRRVRRMRSPAAPVSQVMALANVDGVEALPRAQHAQAEGIGLYRTEVEALRLGRLLTEDEQRRRYEAMVKAFPGGPVYIRLLDLGADKSAPFLGLPEEINPALGNRGSRLLLERPELWRDQARALALASRAGPIRVIYPMILSLEQFIDMRSLFEAFIADVKGAQLSHGVMFETPSACLDAARIFTEAAFGSIGTNDLIQYTFATDREAPLDDFDAEGHPAVWALLKAVADAGKKAHKPVSVCGEWAGRPSLTPHLLKVGLRILSAEALAIAAVRRAAARSA